MVKLTHFSNPFGITLILRLNMLSSCTIRWESQFLNLWNKTWISWFSLRLILQSLCAEPLYCLVIWQWSPTCFSGIIILCLSLILKQPLIWRFNISSVLKETKITKNYKITIQRRQKCFFPRCNIWSYMNLLKFLIRT